MKKIKLNKSKLKLNKELISNLSVSELRKIKGGYGDCPPSDRLCSGGHTTADCAG